ncbi:MAG: pyridoxal-phosphate dependent enzyme [Hyphomicrobiaceae bacterium]
MNIIANPYRGRSAGPALPASIPFPVVAGETFRSLLARCPEARPTPLLSLPELARQAGLDALHAKDERQRMRIGSFKALGGAYVIARDALKADPANLANALAGVTYVTASAGNHGLSVAAGAKVFGATAVVHVSAGVSESFARRLRAEGAEVVRSGDDYEQSVEAARQQAEGTGGRFLSDGSWEGYTEIPLRVMEGYTQLMLEAGQQLSRPPTHVFAQAGVGGLAGAMAVAARRMWGDAPVFVVVEPTEAAALFESIRAGCPVTAPGKPSSMGRLDCKDPSLIALKGLARDADHFATITDDEVAARLVAIADAGVRTSPSGGAGLAGALCANAHRDVLRLDGDSRVLVVVSEGPEDPA